MIGIPIKKHLKLRYQEEGRTCRTCSDRRKNEGICIKKNRTNDIGGISSFYFYFPFGINDTRFTLCWVRKFLRKSTIVYSMN